MLNIPDPLDQPATPDALRHQARHGVLDGPALRRALALIGHTPPAGRWAAFLDLLLLVLGAGLLVSGVIFFFAFNWDGMHRFAKLGLIEGALAAAVGLASWRGLDTLPGKVALSAAAGMVGALMAVFGQVYQTGADSYQLFALWALLISGWVLAGRFTPLWAFWLLLLDLAIWLWAIETRGELDGATLIGLFSLNALALALWEWARRQGVAWLRSRWTPRLFASLAIGALAIATLLVILGDRVDLDGDPWLLAAPPLFVAAVGLLAYHYSQRLFDPFILVVTALAACVCLNSWVSEVLDLDEEILIVLGLLVIGQTAAVVAWVRRRALLWEVRQ
ncbi:MAG TPA: DUF2157 domain-containing protein [Herpetosiphonaceae bacterium]|nr:DUF2157 domain-containing protein [Herpetosiphonaceae bacterium]